MRSIAALAACILLTAAPAFAADDITSKMVNDPSAGWAAMGSAKVELFKDPAVQGGTAERVTIAGRSANPWDSGAHIAISKPLAQGEVLLLAFWARAEQPPKGSAVITFNVNFQKDAAPYTSLGSAMLSVGPQWKMYFVQAAADKDYKANETGVQLQLAVDEMVIDLGPLFILNYGKDYDRSKLPKN